ncbi:MAG TPA: MBL fold metallo-hydrolase [Vicinamibacterales bacterium]|nr:MBL fold metallo-hydrolase [Vicinamibacterales bacterium]
MTRRELLLAGLAALAPRPAGRTRLVLLGTGGGPSPKRLRSAPAQVLVAGGRAYVVDCGDGVARQLVRAGVRAPQLRAVFLTHHHSDHNADYGNLLLFAWIDGLREPVDTYGPPPLARITRLLFETHAYDIATRMADEGRAPLEPLVRPHELTAAGEVMRDEHVRVTAALNAHPPVSPSFAYRFDAADRSIVISGDTAFSPAVVALARGADVLVHEAIYPPAVDRLAAERPHAARLREHLLASHTSPEDAGRVAAAAGVTTLVLSHLVPGDDARITDAMWAEGARRHFGGRIVVGRDLMEI